MHSPRHSAIKSVKRKWTVRLCLTLGTLLLASCVQDTPDTLASNGLPGGASVIAGASGERAIPLSCKVADMNSWVHYNMLDYYLFYDQISPAFPSAEYATSEALVEALRVPPQDTFSYMTDEATYNAFFNEGETFGFGWNIDRASDNNIYFSLIDANSPLATLSVERGDQLLSINDIAIEDFFALSSQQKIAALGVAGETKTITLSIRKATGSTQQLNVTSAAYPLQTVLDASVKNINGVKVGYLHFYSFISTSTAELEQAFAMFANEGVDELVLDMRFNGGGRVAVAAELASHILGTGNTDKVFTTFAYNDKYQSYNVSLNFLDMTSSLNLNRLFVLQSGSTCSASELVINSLRPFIPVITVGERSCGKPYGSSPNTACSKVLNALEIELVNADNVGGYFDGIPADCAAIEDVTQPLGLQSEPLLAAALGYISNGICNSANARATTKASSEALLPKPAWQGGNNL